MSTWTSAVWSTEEFLADLRAFVTSAVGEPDAIERVGQQPWSAVWRVTAAGATSYAKQNCPGQAHEAGLAAVLARLAPEYVVPVLAADAASDLLLTAGLGPTLEETRAAADVRTWCRIAAEAAALQRRVADDPAALGLTPLAPGDATTYVANAVGRLAALDPDDPRQLPPEDAIRLEALLPTVCAWSEQVEDLDLPLTLVHNDLHASNVVAAGGRLRFFDFGDAVRGEPLGNLLVPLQHLAADPAVDERALAQVADAAIEVWSDLAPARDLRAALPAALQLARLARVESWRRCVATMTLGERAVFGAAPASWLRSLLDPPPIGAAGTATPNAART